MRPHSILFINRVYPPAEGATGTLLSELAGELAQAGWRVTVVTSRTSAQQARSETRAGVRIERVSGLPFTRASHWRRALSYLSLYPALLWRAWWLPRHEVVVALTDPPLLLALGALLTWSKRSRLIHWAQDLYPELAEEVGVLRKGGLLAQALRGLSTWALRRCDRIVAVGHCMKARLTERGVSSEVIEVIPNWGQISCADPGSFRREHGLEYRFVVMYSGNLGLAHPFEAMLDAAERLQPALPRMEFVLVGDGPRLPWVREEVARRQLSHVRFLPFQPREKLGQSLAAADIHLASMKQNLCGLVVPSKVYGVLAAGRPCVFLGPEASEPAQFILEHGCGSVLENATGARLAACLAQWATNAGLLQQAQRRAKSMAGRVGLSAAVEAFADVLEAVEEQPARELRRVKESQRAHRSSPTQVRIAP